jgi:hypothetical protein
VAVAVEETQISNMVVAVVEVLEDLDLELFNLLAQWEL